VKAEHKAYPTEFGTEEDEGLGEIFLGLRTIRGLALREVMVEMVGTAREWLCTSTLKIVSLVN
jgi:hypothetical protein